MKSINGWIQTPTSTSLLSVLIVFALSFLYLHTAQPAHILEECPRTGKMQRCVRRIMVYSLLYASTVGLAVFGWMYFREKKSIKKERQNKHDD